MKLLDFVSLFVVVALLPGLATAAGTVTLGGLTLVDPSPVAVIRQHIEVSRGKVEVEYELLNPESREVTTVLLVTLPEYQYEPANAGYSRPECVKLWVNGLRIRVRPTFRAVAKSPQGEIDATERLRVAGISIERLDGTGDVEEVDLGGHVTVRRGLDSLSPQVRNDLQRLGLFAPDEDGAFPTWTVSEQYQWKQHFQAGAVTKVRVAFVPVPTVESDVGSAAVHEAACSEGTTRRKTRSGEWTAWWFDLSSWVAEPVRGLTLSLDAKPGRDELASWCWDGRGPAGTHGNYRLPAGTINRRTLRVFFFVPASAQWTPR